jgi:hypothetical protein
VPWVNAAFAIILRKKDMKKLCIILGMTVFGWIGWWIGAKIGFMTAYILSTLASMAGVYVGWRIYRDYLA